MTEEEWWDEERDRKNDLGRFFQAAGMLSSPTPGIGPPPTLNPDGTLADKGEDGDELAIAMNRFCPTGKGGGIVTTRGEDGAAKGMGKGEGATHLEAHKAAMAKAQAKAQVNPKPTKDEVKAAKKGIAKLGANKFRRNFVGNTKDRAKRREALLKEFGDGKSCPCVYCGVKLGEGGAQLEQDKIMTTAQGGRYRTPNLIPSCGPCNKQRSDTQWGGIKWPGS